MVVTCSTSTERPVPISTRPRSHCRASRLGGFCLLGLSVLLGACEASETEKSDYWDDAEVEAVCQEEATKYQSCETGTGPSLEELVESCRESIMVDNHVAIEACHDANLAYHACLAARTCEELVEQDMPCPAESQALRDSC